MHWFDAFPPVPLPFGPTVMIGNFDGVHRGHRYVVDTAKALGGPVIALTFEPHPRLVLGRVGQPFRLTPYDVKRQALLDAGADHVLALRFDQMLANMSAEAFISEVLVGALGARKVVVGEDYRFGHKRVGDRQLLTQVGAASGFEVLSLPGAKDNDGSRYSSSLIRKHIGAGRTDKAANLLGRRWTMSGTAERRADGIIGLASGEHVRPAAGHYAVAIHRPGRQPTEGIALVEDGANDILILGCEHAGPIRLAFDYRLDSLPVRTPLAAARSLSHCL